MAGYNQGYYEIFESDLEDKLIRLNRIETDGVGFECVIANLYQEKGYDIIKGYNGNTCGFGPTQETRQADFGIDLVVEKGGERYAIQCKHFQTGSISSDTVQKLLGAYPGNCIFITTTKYSRPARIVANYEQRLRLLEWNEIQTEFQKYFFNK